MFHFTPLLSSASPASSSLLSLDGGVNILIDIGWTPDFSAASLSALEKHVSTLSLVLLTHPTLEHIGAYAHACKHVPQFRSVPVYATTPVANLGRTLLSDLYASSTAASRVIPLGNISGAVGESDGAPQLLFDPPTGEEIAAYFAAIHPLKYSQPHQPLASAWSPPLGNLTITAYGAGHTLGGTIWHIQHNTESIVYAHSWNQGRENLLPGATLLTGGGQEIIEPLQRPTALVCDARGVEQDGGESLSRTQRDARLVGMIRETIAQGGKVLIPTDSSARMLELASLLNQTWREGHSGPHADTCKNARLYMASKSASASVRYLQSMLEWVEDSVRAEAEAAMTRGKGQGVPDSPLEWKYVKLLERESGVQRALARAKPCVLLASDASLEWGFARQAFRALASDPRNLVIMTETPTSDGLGKQLWDAFHSSSSTGAKIITPSDLSVSLRDPSTASLSADEAALYETYAARQRQQHSSLQGDNTLLDPSATTAAEADDVEDESSDDDEEDEDAEHQGRALNLSAQLTQAHKRHGAAAATAVSDAELGVNILLRKAGGVGPAAVAVVHDYDVREKRGREKVFPFIGRKVRGDEFGEVVRAEEYLRAEEKDDVDAEADVGRGAGAAVGQKRKWGDSAGPAGKGRRGGDRQQGERKRARIQGGKGGMGGPDDIDAAIARATGEANGAGGSAPPAADDSDGDEEDEESDYEPEDAFPSGPRKLVYSDPQQVEVQCRLSYINFAGLHDLRSLQMIIPLFRPRKVILVSGNTDVLVEECRRLLKSEEDGAGATEIFTPGEGETVDASVDTNAWSVLLSRALVRKLTWQNVKGLGVVALTARLKDPDPIDEVEDEDGEGAKKKQKLLKAEDGTPEPASKALVKPSSGDAPELPVLDLPTVTSATVSAPRVTQPVHVGDTRLADLRALLRASSHDAVFSGEGTLLVDGAVVVRKLRGGRVEIEMSGRGMGTFESVRRAVYNGLAVVAGV